MSTTFIPGITTIDATWLNNVDAVVTNLDTPTGAAAIGITPTGIVSSTDVQGAVAELAVAVEAATYADSDTRAAPLTGLSLVTGTAISAVDSVLTAFGKLQKQISDNVATMSSLVGLTANKINFKNIAGTFTSFLANANTAVRTYTFPDKDGTVAMTSDIQSPAMVLLTSATISTTVATVDFLNTFTAAFDRYTVEITGLTQDTAANLKLRFAVAGVVDTSSVYGSVIVGGNTAVLSAGGNLDTTIASSVAAAAAAGLSATIDIRNTNGTTSNKSFGVYGSYTDGAGRKTLAGEGAYSGTSAISGFRLYPATGNFTAGTIRVYGTKNT